MLVLIDNYDSFTYNLYHMLCEYTKVVVKYNDSIDVESVIGLQPNAIVISPGPGCPPDSTGICSDLVIKASENDIPVLGICLGHQVIGDVFGGLIVRAPRIVHGKTSKIYHLHDLPTIMSIKGGCRLFEGIPSPFTATRYHSLVIDSNTFPNDELDITAWSNHNLIMGVQHKRYRIFGVQFHPESFKTSCGKIMIENFMKIANIA